MLVAQLHQRASQSYPCIMVVCCCCSRLFSMSDSAPVILPSLFLAPASAIINQRGTNMDFVYQQVYIPHHTGNSGEPTMPPSSFPATIVAEHACSPSNKQVTSKLRVTRVLCTHKTPTGSAPSTSWGAWTFAQGEGGVIVAPWLDTPSQPRNVPSFNGGRRQGGGGKLLQGAEWGLEGHLLSETTPRQNLTLTLTLTHGLVNNGNCIPTA